MDERLFAYPLVKIMKLMQAIKAIEEHRRINAFEEYIRMNLVHVHSVFPQEDVIALKKKTGESNVKDAVSKAVYHYLKCQKTYEDNA
jgi:hypothetical protein